MNFQDSYSKLAVGAENMKKSINSNGMQSREAIRAVLLVSPSVLHKRRTELNSLLPGSKKRVDFSTGQQVSLESGGSVIVELVDSAPKLIERMERGPVDAVLVDNREAGAVKKFANSLAGLAMPQILADNHSARAVNRQSIFVILADFESTAHHAYAVGALQLGGVFVDPASLGAAIESACRLVDPPKPGKIALCLAGGGIEGFFYEMGALRALDAHLVGSSIIDFDIFSGISSGAIISAFLANGVYPEELSDSLHGRPSRVKIIGRNVLFDPNVAELASRVKDVTGDLLRGRAFRRPRDTALKVLPNAFFSGDRLKWHFEKELTKPGMTNDYHQLKKELFVGATDQDSGEHVVFGEKGMRDVPISHTIRASSAMTPYYPAEKIKGRYYIDGIFTRTINLDVAVDHGARLAISVNPLNPVQVDQAGYTRERGGFFNSIQSLKSMMTTRLTELMGRAAEAYPNVALYVFSPTTQDLEKMSTTLMRFGGASETEEMAFQSVSRRITENHAWMAADFARHGFELSPKPYKNVS
jgi:NTE family protein